MIDFTGKTDKEIAKIVVKDNDWLVTDRKCHEGLWHILTQVFFSE